MPLSDSTKTIVSRYGDKTRLYQSYFINKRPNIMRKIIVTVAPVCHVGKEIPAECKNPGNVGSEQSLREVYEKLKM